MARTSHTPFVVLGILGVLDQKPLSGYDIKHIIDGTISHFWSESFGQIYPVLKQLTSDKLIRARADKENGRKRIVYTITAEGRKRLGAWLEKPPERGPHRDELILKLFFGSLTEIPVLIRHLQGHRDRAKSMVKQYAAWLKQLDGENERYTPFQIITLRGGVAMGKAFVQWADESLATLTRMRSAK
jgi:PadR family transcriptional regulator, regulatory protein AphA